MPNAPPRPSSSVRSKPGSSTRLEEMKVRPSSEAGTGEEILTALPRWSEVVCPPASSVGWATDMRMRLMSVRRTSKRMPHEHRIRWPVT